MKAWLKLGASLLLLSFLAGSLVLSKSIKNKAKVGSPQDYRSRVLFVNFWASWCRPCRDEMPDLRRFERGQGGAVRVLLVNSTVQDDERAARLFLERWGPGLRSAFDRTGDATAAYGVYFFPTTFVLDAGGVVRARIEGRMSLAMMEAALRKARGVAPAGGEGAGREDAGRKGEGAVAAAAGLP